MHDAGRPVPVEGARLHTQSFGDPHGRPVLLLHGGGGTLDDFDALAPELTRYHCVAMDTRGHGASTLGVDALTYVRLAQDVEAVMRAYDLRKPILIGHSDGGIAGIHVAARGVAPLGGLVTLGAHADPPNAQLMRDIFDKISAASWRKKFPEGVALYEKLNPQPDFDRFFAVVLDMWRNTAPGNYPHDEAREVKCPTLVLAGDADHLVPRDATLALAAAIPNAKLGVLPFASHIMHQETPERVAPYIHDFIAGLDA